MITVRLKGGMGNQMFQYAFAKGMASALNTDFQMDCSLLLDRARGKDFVYRAYDLSIFRVKEKFSVPPPLLKALYQIRSSRLSNKIKRITTFGQPIVKEKHFHTDQSLLATPLDKVVYDGWWQSERYFEKVAPEIRKEFTFKEPILPVSERLAHEIRQSNSICLNVRRTDFLKNDTLNATNKAYFERAAHKMAEMVESPRFFIFSDDIRWCEEQLTFDHPTQVVQHDVKGRKFGNYLHLMTLCKHFIIPNSSFAWWAAWLSNNPQKRVIAPHQWFAAGDHDTKDLIPSQWLRL